MTWLTQYPLRTIKGINTPRGKDVRTEIKPFKDEYLITI